MTRNRKFLLAGFALVAATSLGWWGLSPTFAEDKPLRNDMAKGLIESPLKSLVSNSTAIKNPKVAPGNINWHKDLATAMQASKKTRKPILVFHMMGNLDDRFC